MFPLANNLNFPYSDMKVFVFQLQLFKKGLFKRSKGNSETIKKHLTNTILIEFSWQRSMGERNAIFDSIGQQMRTFFLSLLTLSLIQGRMGLTKWRHQSAGTEFDKENQVNQGNFIWAKVERSKRRKRELWRKKQVGAQFDKIGVSLLPFFKSWSCRCTSG